MLFYLSEELVDGPHSDDQLVRIKRAVENILKSVWESKHLVYATLSTITKLKEIVDNRDCLNVLIFIDNNYSFINYSSIKKYIHVTPTDNIASVIECADKIEMHVSINYFQNSDLLQETRILCEDISDASFFEKICTHFIESNSIGEISLKYEPEHGGGNSISVLFEKHITNKNKFCLAFCDNDKRHPNSGIGETLKNLRDIDFNNNILCEFIELDSHEIENLVPFNYLNDITEKRLNQSGIDFINQIKESKDKELLKFYDIKKGISKKQVSGCEYFRAFMETLLPYCNNSNIDITKLEDADKIIPHTGKIIQSLMQKATLFKTMQPILLDYQKEEWKKIGSNFLYWTCARNNEAMNG